MRVYIGCLALMMMAVACRGDSSRTAAALSEGDSNTQEACAAYEPNDAPGVATPFEGSGSLQARVCGRDDQDWFALDAQAGDLLTIRLEFRHAQGDLDLYLYNGDLEEIARSQSSDNDEFIQLQVERSDRYTLQVFGYEGASADYTLLVRRNSDPGDCDEDAYEDNDVPEDAQPLGEVRVVSGRVCTGDDDLFAVELPAGVILNASLAFTHDAGDLDLELLDAEGASLATSDSSTDGEFIRHAIEREGRYTARIFGYEGASNSYTLSLELEGLAPTGEHRVSGQVTFEDPIFDPVAGSYSETTWAPLPGAVVEVLERGSEVLLGSSVTDAQGGYAVQYDGASAAQIKLRVLSRVREEAAVDVVDGQRQLYAAVLTEGLQPPSEAPEQVAAVQIPLANGVAEPFNALEATRRGFVWWGAQVGFEEPPPPLHVVWQPGRALSCGTCYQHSDSPPSIYLLGLLDDNDALDDPVILHEVGHYVQNTYSSDDSPGGSHDGTPTDPRLAWAEGWATFFSSMVRGDVAYYDTLGDWYILHDVEEPDPDYGAFTGRDMSADISEYLVASMLWDIYDASEGTRADSVALGLGAVEPLLDHLRSGEPRVRGVEGVDLVDYLDGLHCAESSEGAALGDLIGEVRFPYDGRSGCKLRAPVTIEAQVEKGHVWYTATPRRPVDARWLMRCEALRGCAVIGESGPATARTPVRAARPVPMDAGGWIEARLVRGGGIWTAVASHGKRGAVEVAPWTPGSPAADGRPVVEARLGSPPR